MRPLLAVYTERAFLLAPGAALATVIALAATFVSSVHGGPQFLYALFMGVAFHYLSQEPRTRPGIEFCARSVLRLGVALLGARITVDQIQALGWSVVLSVVTAVVTTLLFGLLTCRFFGLTRTQGILSGGAVGICGASAALAISAVLPRDKISERFTLMVVVSVTLLSTVAMVLYPLIAKWLELSPRLAGLFLGATIHDVAQVVGAGYTLGQPTGDVATVVKLFRVAMLTVVVIAISAAFRRPRSDGTARRERSFPRQSLVPWFLWVFMGMVLANSVGLFTPGVRSGLDSASRGCLVVAIAALGVKTSFQQLARAGWGTMALILAETLWLAILMLCVVLMLKL
ncbi:YeiH family protein [Variovorax sp. DT-64]|uniref:YeiH family protein n=1 Tax=Variovorax sp. DT-64 TaxID=3396160 RepID=UPI003F1B150F